MLSGDIIAYALLGGIIPAVFWLKFWLRESTHQEPRRLILGSFLVGMLTVLIAIPLEQSVSTFFTNYSIVALSLWALIEEMLKFGAAYFVALRTRFVDEPIDATIYIITSALGFSAMENMFFLISPLSSGSIAEGLVTINLRFVGATLLHVISSGVIGIALGYAFYKKISTKRIAAIIGIIIAVTLHTLFNSFIINSEKNLLIIFSVVWIGLVAVILILEKIKKIKNII